MQTPMSVAPRAAAKPTVSDTRVPCRMPSSTSRPSSSVPNRCAADGGSMTSLVIARGSDPGMTSRASMTRVRTITYPAAAKPARCEAKRGQNLRMGRVADPNARIEHAIEDVSYDVCHHHGDGREEENALQHGIVAIADRGDEEVAKPRPGEHGLHQNGAGERIAEVVADHRDHRDQTVGQDVPPKDGASTEPFGPRSEHVILRDGGEHACPRNARHHSDVVDRDAESRQREVPKYISDGCPAGRRVAQRNHALRRQPSQLDGEQNDEQLTQPKDGHRVADQAESRDGAVVYAAGARCCCHCQNDAEHCRQRERREHEQQRQACAIENEAQYRLTIGKRETEVALPEIPKIEAELMGNRPVETKLLPHLLYIACRRGKVVHQRLHGVTWHHVNNEEVDHEDG